jgi:hypothetical protein
MHVTRGTNMGAREKVNGMNSTPERVRESVRKAVSFGKSFPLHASASAGQERERALSLERAARANPIDVWGSRAREGIHIRPEHPGGAVAAGR